MSLLPKPSPEEFEELFQLFRGALIQPGITPTQARERQKQLRERLQRVIDKGRILTLDVIGYAMVSEFFRALLLNILWVLERFGSRLSPLRSSPLSNPNPEHGITAITTRWKHRHELREGFCRFAWSMDCHAHQF